MTGIVGGWTLNDFNPMEAIPSAAYLTGYSGGPDDFMVRTCCVHSIRSMEILTQTQATPLNELAAQIEEGSLRIQIGKVFKLDEIVEAHRLMESNKAGGKIVVVT